VNYYKRHLGDYARDTGHLTTLEHGIYTLLLDFYYSSERPIPRDKAFRIAKANPEETQMVLTEFFKLTDLGWIHSRADREIAASREKTERNREVGKLGGRRKVTQTVTQEEPKRLANGTQATSHKPLAITKEKKGPASADPSLFEGVSDQVVKDFTAMRKAKGAPITQTAMKGIRREADLAGLTLENALTITLERGWRSFKAEWVKPEDRGRGEPPPLPRMQA
jgi:uncharacterized protein YdaU (DUF1376 family)